MCAGFYAVQARFVALRVANFDPLFILHSQRCLCSKKSSAVQAFWRCSAVTVNEKKGPRSIGFMHCCSFFQLFCSWPWKQSGRYLHAAFMYGVGYSRPVPCVAQKPPRFVVAVQVKCAAALLFLFEDLGTAQCPALGNSSRKSARAPGPACRVHMHQRPGRVRALWGSATPKHLPINTGRV